MKLFLLTALANKLKATVFVRIKVIPGSRITEFFSLMSDGSYRIRLKAPPVDGKANIELIRWMSRQFGVSREEVCIKSGTTSRQKLIRIMHPTTKPAWFNE